MTADDLHDSLKSIVQNALETQREVLRECMWDGIGITDRRFLERRDTDGSWNIPDTEKQADLVAKKLLAELEAQGVLPPA
jgi:hypothetical protein